MKGNFAALAHWNVAAGFALRAPYTLRNNAFGPPGSKGDRYFVPGGTSNAVPGNTFGK